VDLVERHVEVALESWLDLTRPTLEARRAIVEALDQDLCGQLVTGMRPFRRDGQLGFVHTWLMIVGLKASELL
jgi:hypothetical protein